MAATRAVGPAGSKDSDPTGTLSPLVSGSVLCPVRFSFTSGNIALLVPGASHQKGTARCDLSSQARKSEEGP